MPSVNPWRAACIVMVFITICGALYTRVQHYTYKSLEESYRHPAVEIRTKIVTKKGPVRIVEKIVVENGRTETTREITRGEVVTASDTENESKPVPIKDLVGNKRWIVGLGGLVGEPQKEYFAYGGATVFGTIDLCAGITTEKRAMLQTGVRF